MDSFEFIVSLSGINVQLNWTRMFKERWPCSACTITSHAQLRKLYMPWYLGPSGRPALFNIPNATPVTVSEVADDLGRWPAKQQKIMGYAALFRATNPPVQITVPVYSLPKNRKLLLNGHHRAVALALAGARFEVALLSIEGPVEEDALSDLRHWKE